VENNELRGDLSRAAFFALLHNEFLKAHRKMEEQDSKIERANDRLELRQPVPQLVVINR
jgi:hypothetical protein